MMNGIFKTALAIVSVVLLSACGSGDGSADPVVANTPTGGTTGNPLVVTMGSSGSGSFEEGILDVGVVDLSAGGSTSISVQLKTGDGAPYSESATVTFSSDCHSAGLAEIAEPSVTTDIGTATTTYTDLGCAGTDTISARATIGDTVLTATGSVNVSPATLGAIEFISATPETIGLRGTASAGIKETATLKFRVLNDVGGPMVGEDVEFALSTEAGGLELANTSAVSGSDGTVSVIVRSGTVPTAVRVEATVVGSNISTQSSSLTVTTAIADQNSFSLSASELAPEAWSTDGVEVDLNVLAADRFNNFVPDGTAIVFTTELGAIVGQCQTVDGACSVKWRSQSPRTDSDNVDPLGRTDNGRTTIIAHAIGEETFEDADGDGVFTGSTQCPAPAGTDCFYDLPEAWRDDNEDGVRDDPSEPFVDFDSNSTYDGADGQWNGVSCDASGCTADLVTVSDSVTLVMARNFADIHFFDTATGNAIAGPVDISGGTSITTCIGGTGTFVPVSPASLASIVQAQPMPSGTTVSFSASVGVLPSKTEFTAGLSNSDVPVCIDMPIGGSGSGNAGYFEVTVITPGENETFATIGLTD